MAIDQDDIDDLEETILTNAGKPAEVKTEAASVRQHSISDLIELERFQRAKAATGSGPFAGIQLGKIVPPGAVSKNNES